MVNFKVEPGQAVGVIGPSGSGKSTLARVSTGVWSPTSGRIRLDGAILDQYTPEDLAACSNPLTDQLAHAFWKSRSWVA
ncbi:ATP-binding cassette domain-containing protein [Ruegeria sp. Ofav3-42]|uniref:ATP-binding cassette domain-containing protein n=1 Tax=Ruegeria sp. Ofav3-42 TaxID=2917759 RepID=UPI00351D4AEA